MPYYFLVQIRIDNETEYNKYISKVNEVFQKFKGTYLAVDENPECIEGKWDYSRSVLIKFSSKKDFEEWYYSPEYQEIIKYRLSAAKCDAILIEGK